MRHLYKIKHSYKIKRIIKNDIYSLHKTMQKAILDLLNVAVETPVDFIPPTYEYENLSYAYVYLYDKDNTENWAQEHIADNPTKHIVALSVNAYVTVCVVKNNIISFVLPVTRQNIFKLIKSKKNLTGVNNSKLGVEFISNFSKLRNAPKETKFPNVEI